MGKSEPPIVSPIVCGLSAIIGAYFLSQKRQSTEKAKFFESLPTYSLNGACEVLNHGKTPHLSLPCELLGKVTLPLNQGTSNEYPVTQMHPIGKIVAASKYKQYRLYDTLYKRVKEKKNEQGEIIKEAEYGTRRSENWESTFQQPKVQQLYVTDRSRPAFLTLLDKQRFEQHQPTPSAHDAPSAPALDDINGLTNNTPTIENNNNNNNNEHHLILTANNIPQSLFELHNSVTDIAVTEPMIITTPEQLAEQLDKPKFVGYRREETIVPLELNVSIIGHFSHDGNNELRIGRLNSPSGEYYPLTVSTKNKTEIVNELYNESSTYRYCTWASFGLSAISGGYAIVATVNSIISSFKKE